MPVPMGLESSSTSPGRAPDLAQTRSGCTRPCTARPKMGSSERIVWPPATIPPAPPHAVTCVSCRPVSRSAVDGPVTSATTVHATSAGQQQAGVVIQPGDPQLGHGALLDLADALPRQLEVLGHIVEGARLAAVEA